MFPSFLKTEANAPLTAFTPFLFFIRICKEK